ncbi:hypothetical protein ANN_13531 [Periplaneta americana]|uniref:Uncharacterized protein n=1 Tax=Periplaneta americana TaxID=6978 RepID=A0ABQ8TJP0_PERAM|nr:hypothetical protein ANN_13531 [Periplaneta americana]
MQCSAVCRFAADRVKVLSVISLLFAPVDLIWFSPALNIVMGGIAALRALPSTAATPPRLAEQHFIVSMSIPNFRVSEFVLPPLSHSTAKSWAALEMIPNHRFLKVTKGTGWMLINTETVEMLRQAVMTSCKAEMRDCQSSWSVSETETLGHVLGFCKKGELLRNNRHHRARTAIAKLLRNRGWEVHEEIHCVSEDDYHRRVDIIDINRRTQKAMVLDPTICFERDKSSTAR